MYLNTLLYCISSLMKASSAGLPGALVRRMTLSGRRIVN